MRAAIYCTFTGHGIVLKGTVQYYRSGDANGFITEHTDLGGKKTKGDFYSSWLLIEAAVINQVTAVSTRTTMQQDRAPFKY